MRVKTNSLYRYNPNGWDSIHPCIGNSLNFGQIVRVINLPMAPKANTMGQCYVADPITKKFICLLSTGSLESLTYIQRRCYDLLVKSLKRSRHPEPKPIFAGNDGCTTNMESFPVNL